MVEGATEVAVLLEHACRLRHRRGGQGVPPTYALKLVILAGVASSLAEGEWAPGPEGLPSTATECVDRAALLALDWEPFGLPVEAVELILGLCDLRLELLEAATS